VSLLARRLSVGADFTPDESGPPTANLVQWLRADSLALSNDDPVDTWDDKQLTFDMTASGTQRPTFKTSAVNGHPALLFDASDDRMAGGPTFGSSTPFSIFYVANYTDGTSTFRRAIQGSSNYFLGPRELTWRWYYGSFATQLGTANTEWIIHYLIVSGTGGTHYLRQGGSTVSSTHSTTNGPGQLGLGAEGAFAERMGGHIAEVLVYDAELGTTPRDEAVDYLKDRYAIS
jgi:hypothetical protein